MVFLLNSGYIHLNFPDNFPMWPQFDSGGARLQRRSRSCTAKIFKQVHVLLIYSNMLNK